MIFFLLALFFICTGTLMYEVVLTRLLSVVSWYYLAFVSISMAMFGMTAGALSIQLRPDLFGSEIIRRRLAQCAMATAISLPLTLVTMLAIPIEVSLSLETVFSFLLFSAVIAVPFFFSGIVVCISLTRTPFPMGQIYFTDLAGAAFGWHRLGRSPQDGRRTKRHPERYFPRSCFPSNATTNKQVNTIPLTMSSTMLPIPSKQEMISLHGKTC